MGHTNYRRKLKIRKPLLLKPNKVIRPDIIYNRNKEKIKLSDIFKEIA
jgi:hypothetical protein